MNIITQSIAVYSTWTLLPELDTLIDCGEGCALALGIDRLASIEHLFITHDHMDHVAGLLQVVNLRRRQPNKKPLTIHLPYHSDKLLAIKSVLKNPHHDDQETWVEMDINNPSRIKKNLTVRAFPTRHAKGSLGFQIWEDRKRRLPGLKHLSERELTLLAQEHRRKGEKVRFDEPYQYHLLTYTGDTAPLPEETIGKPEVLIHEATFPTEELREDGHCTLQDALRASKASGADTLLIHLSRHYKDYPNTKFRWAHHVPPAPKKFNFSLGRDPKKIYKKTQTGPSL